MRKKKKLILFLQLPLLDNDISGKTEHPCLAAVYLENALKTSFYQKKFDVVICPEKFCAETDDHSIIQYLLKINPDIIAFTLYLWNIERSLHIARILKNTNPDINIITGGPEIARNHPFIFKEKAIKAVVEGEGENIFPFLVTNLNPKKQGKWFSNIAIYSTNNFCWGKISPPSVELQKTIPPPSHYLNYPNSSGMAYLEASRGCSMRCTFCCYNQQRKHVSFLSPTDIIKRIEILKERNTKEIRFIDPTFNSHPSFETILEGIAKINSSADIKFFAEIRPDTITPKHAYLLKKANFTELEIGVQSINPKVLSAIKRNTNMDALLAGIKNLSSNKLYLTIDIMCGLPFQKLRDIKKSIDWACTIKNADIQFLHTLLLPGTNLRDHKFKFGLRAQKRPPYRVLATPTLSPDEIISAEIYARQKTRRDFDCPTRKFIGHTLPDLFEEKITVSLLSKPHKSLPGTKNKRAIIFAGKDLYQKRNIIVSWIKLALQEEPFILWQFVVKPTYEEPLDLFDIMIREIKSNPTLWLDRMSPDPLARLVSRRILVMLDKNNNYSHSWINTVNSLLQDTFY